MAWDKITTPLTQGGLGLINLDIINKAMLAKKFWRIITNQGRLLNQVIIQKYGHRSIEHISEGNTNISWRWKDIRNYASFIANNLYWQVVTNTQISLRSRYW